MRTYTQYIKISLGILCAYICFCGVQAAHAASDTFIVSQQVHIIDSIAPSIPTGVVVTPISSSQLTLSWLDATDNVGVVGYQVFREGVQIGTTTSTSYADIGLSPATTYAYTLRAYDAANNISGFSATTTGTTQSVSVSSTTPSSIIYGSKKPSVVIPKISDVRIVATKTSAALSWTTSVPTQSLVSWGLTHEYEIASTQERAATQNHSIELLDLEPGHTYVFRIRALYGAAMEVVLYEGSFVTEALPDSEAPANVHTLVARVNGKDVLLSWENPSAIDFEYVRIVRKENGFPSDAEDGVIVFEGSATEFRDVAVIGGQHSIGYGVFAYDTKGNGSSGAIARVVLTPSSVTEEAPSSDDVALLRFNDLWFFEGSNKVTFTGTEVLLSGDTPFKIHIPYERLPEHLKTILITLTDPDDATKVFSFLLRVTKEKDAYEALIEPLQKGKAYPITLSLFDYKDRTISHVSGVVRIAEESISHADTRAVFSGFLAAFQDPLWFWMILLILFGFLLTIAFKHQKEQRRV